MSPHTDAGAMLKLAADLDECSFKPNVNSRFVGARDLMKRAAVVIRQAASQGSGVGERSEVRTEQADNDLGIVLSALHLLEEAVGETFDDEGGIVAQIEADYKARQPALIKASRRTAQAASEPVAFINRRLEDLAEANTLYGKDQRLGAPDKIARNDREISWLKDLRSMILTAPSVPSADRGCS